MSCFDVQQLMKKDQWRRGVFMETLSSSVIHKSKHRVLNRMCSIKQKHITSERRALISQAILLQHYSASCQHPHAGGPGERHLTSVWVPSHFPFFYTHVAPCFVTNLQRGARLPRLEIKVVVVPGAKDLQDSPHLLDVPITQRTTWGPQETINHVIL